jgi:hypothetical protein
MRNLLLDRRQAFVLVDKWTNRFAPLRSDTGTATWSETELEQILSLLGLSPDADRDPGPVLSKPGA